MDRLGGVVLAGAALGVVLAAGQDQAAPVAAPARAATIDRAPAAEPAAGDGDRGVGFDPFNVLEDAVRRIAEAAASVTTGSHR